MSNETIRALVVDDEVAGRVRLIELLKKQPNAEVSGVASTGREAVELIRSVKPNLVFLDIQMPQQDGFEVIQEVGADKMPLTIFVTAYDQYAVQAYEAHAIDYLLKPISDARFEDSFRRVRDHLRARAEDPGNEKTTLTSPDLKQPNAAPAHLERIVLKSGGTLKLLDVDEIDWIEAAGVYVNLHVGTKAYLHRASIAHLEESLESRRFVRVNRSAIINTGRVRELIPRTHGEFTLILKNGTELRLNRGYRGQFETWLRQSL